MVFVGMTALCLELQPVPQAAPGYLLTSLSSLFPAVPFGPPPDLAIPIIAAILFFFVMSCLLQTRLHRPRNPAPGHSL